MLLSVVVFAFVVVFAPPARIVVRMLLRFIRAVEGGWIVVIRCHRRSHAGLRAIAGIRHTGERGWNRRDDGAPLKSENSPQRLHENDPSQPSGVHESGRSQIGQSTVPGVVGVKLCMANLRVRPI
jgi:hypothetical protein